MLKKLLNWNVNLELTTYKLKLNFFIQLLINFKHYKLIQIIRVCGEFIEK